MMPKMSRRTIIVTVAALAEPLVGSALAASPPPYTPPQAFVTQRAPTPTDDSGKGYAVGNLWQVGGAVYQAQQVTAGQARWTPATLPNGLALGNILPLDAVPNAVGAYGTARLRKGYTGPALDVTRWSDSTALTVGFAGDYVDAAAVDAFCASTVCSVTKAYDQSVPGGNDMVQATLASAPLWTNTLVNGHRVVNFNPIQINPTCEAGTTPATICSAPNIPYLASTTGSITPNLFSLFAVLQPRNTAFAQGVAAQGGNYVTLSQPVGGVATPGMGYGGVQTTAIPAPVSAGVFSWMVRSGTWTFSATNQTATIAAGASGTPVSGMKLGADVGSYKSDFDGLAWIFYSRTLTPSEPTLVTAILNRLYGLAPQIVDVGVGDGDSIAYGLDTWDGLNYPREAFNQTGWPLKVYNVAYGGSTINRPGDASSRMALFAGGLGAIYAANAKAPNFVVTEAIGTNDIGTASPTAGSGAIAYSRLTAFLPSIKALGPNVRLVLCTVTPRGTGGANGPATQPEVAILNAAIVANRRALGADALADFAADAIIGSPVNVNSNTWYIDGLHPTMLGHQVMAQILAPQIRSLLH